MKKREDKKTSELVLGWKLTRTLAPIYWMASDVKSGEHSADDIVTVPAATLGTHTAIIAQSGSGKSFFLGRLIEEIILKTKSRCVIFDPNADFRIITDVIDEKYWTEAKYDHKKGRGKLPHEKNRDEFYSQWSSKSKRIFVGPMVNDKEFTQLQISLPSLSIDFFAEDVDSMMRSELYHCHELVKSLATLLQIKYSDKNSKIDLLDKAERLLRVARADNDIRKAIDEEFSEEDLVEKTKSKQSLFSSGFLGLLLPFPFPDFIADIKQRKVRESIERIVAAFPYVSHGIERYYFGKAREFHAQGILKTKINELKKLNKQLLSPKKVEVVDLPSFPDKRTQMLSLNSVLAVEWERARSAWANAMAKNLDEDNRVPTFIVVDEAHNLIPKEPHGLASDSLREQFRTIAAEGRKYGLFLILCTQRPDKIDPLILSECENKAIMKLGSKSILDLTSNLLGLEDLPETQLSKCLEFETGRVLLAGRWAFDGSVILYTAMRRTIEGGRSLRDTYWSTPEAIVTEKANEKKLDPVKKGAAGKATKRTTKNTSPKKTIDKKKRTTSKSIV